MGRKRHIVIFLTSCGQEREEAAKKGRYLAVRRVRITATALSLVFTSLLLQVKRREVESKAEEEEDVQEEEDEAEAAARRTGDKRKPAAFLGIGSSQ